MGAREKIARHLLGVSNTHRVSVVRALPEESLLGKRILVTGGTSGIGLATAKACVRSGAVVVITGRENREKMHVALGELGEGAFGLSWSQDKIEFASVCLRQAEELAGGTLDAVFLNAGIYETNTKKWDESSLAKMFAINFAAHYELALIQVGRWKELGLAGTLLATGSNRGLYPDIEPYGCLKTALHSFVQGIARTYGQDGIRANVIAPGMTATEINGWDPGGDMGRREGGRPRVIRAEEIAEVALFLLSDRSSCINGAIVPCDLGDCLR